MLHVEVQKYLCRVSLQLGIGLRIRELSLVYISYHIHMQVPLVTKFQKSRNYIKVGEHVVEKFTGHICIADLTSHIVISQ